ncbi:uncharacterized protein LOC121869166 [Homarus americanus]|nr:uncharacterized protein LOC121869166 [Homarus americanus]
MASRTVPSSQNQPVKSGGCKWLVIGLSGVTGGGKTTLATQLIASLPTTTVYLCQDEYILPDHHQAHLKVPEPLQGPNKNSLCSVDMTKMIADIKHILLTDSADINLVDFIGLEDRGKVIGQGLNTPRPPFRGHKQRSHWPSLLLLDGFLLFNHPEVPLMCDLLYFITLTKRQCLERRKMKVFTSSSLSTQQYFELCAWPQYERHFTDMCESVKGIHFIDGESPRHAVYKRVFTDIMNMLDRDDCQKQI